MEENTPYRGKYLKSPLVKEIFVAPGNGGTELEKSIINVDIQADDIEDW